MIAPIDRRTRNAAGLTMVELLITIAAGSIVILGVYRLLTTTMWSYNLQNQMTDMYQNATYTIKELSEALEQAGADLPNMYYPVILTANSTTNDIKMRVNKKNGKLIFNSDTTCDKIPVTPDSVGKAFVGADSLLVDTGGWSASVQITNVKTGLTTDTVVLAASYLVPQIQRSIRCRHEAIFPQRNRFLHRFRAERAGRKHRLDERDVS